MSSVKDIELANRIVFVGKLWTAHSVGFWATNAAYYHFIYPSEKLRKYKIQRDKWERGTPEWNEAKEVYVKEFRDKVYMAPFEPLFLWFVIYPIFKKWEVTTGHGKVSWKSAVLHLLLFQFLNEFFFYWSHRALHSPLLYGYFHKKHHLFKTPTSLSTESVTITEALVSGVIPNLLPFVLISYIRGKPVPLSIMGAHVFFHTVLSCYSHGGYDFPLDEFLPLQVSRPLKTLLWLLGFPSAKHHDRHHSHFDGNYGNPVFDWMFGTLKG
jgi:sterol desaturase/sphingolipid hydroxylase (fatty acid hydroxylase superfamily)